MTAELPPPLADLAAQYDQLADAAERGHIAHDDALAALAALGVVDAAGQVWGLNPQGEFTCAEYPGAPAVPADPSTFATQAPEYVDPEPTPPGPWGAPAADGHDGDQQGPSVTPHGMPAPAWGAAWDDGGDEEDLGHLLTPPQVPAGGRPAAFDAAPAIRPRMSGRSVHDADNPNGPIARLLRALPTGISSRLPSGSAVWQKNKTLFIVLGLGAVLLILLLWRGDSGTSTALPAPTPPAAGAPSMPVDAAGKTQHTALPTADDAIRVQSALTSGQRTTAAGVLAATVDTPTIANLTAYYYGAAKTGLDLSAGPAAAEGSGAVQQWTISDHDTHVKVQTITVHWVFAGGAWKLSGPPGN